MAHKEVFCLPSTFDDVRGLKARLTARIQLEEALADDDYFQKNGGLDFFWPRLH